MNLPQLPDGEFQPPMEMNIVEKAVKKGIDDNFTDRTMTIGRVAVQTEAKNGRGACHYCGPCQRGCSVGAYFSSQSSTLPAAEKTGNLTILSNSVVESLDYDAQKKRVSGVHVIDANTREKTTYTSKLVFLCASTIGSTQILLNSRSETFPNGLANGSGALGHYLMDHTYRTNIVGLMPGYKDKYYSGNRPNGIYVPRFRNLIDQDEDADFLRGYGFQGSASRFDWQSMSSQISGFGTDFKNAMRAPGSWFFYLAGFGEQLPHASNQLKLSETELDRFGIPQVEFDAEFGANEDNMRLDMVKQGEKMLKAAGLAFVKGDPGKSVPGESIHEMGTARMGNDPSEAVLNKWNQAHEVPNLFVTDGACMTSSSCVNPSLTYMALTARAVDYAVKQLKDGYI